MRDDSDHPCPRSVNRVAHVQYRSRQLCNLVYLWASPNGQRNPIVKMAPVVLMMAHIHVRHPCGAPLVAASELPPAILIEP